MVGGRKEWLSAALFETLAELMLAKVSTLTGVTKADPLVVHRLRQMIDSAGDDSLIEACGGEGYSVVPPVNDSSFDRSLLELDGHGVLSAAMLSYLRERVASGKRFEIGLQTK